MLRQKGKAVVGLPKLSLLFAVMLFVLLCCSASAESEPAWDHITSVVAGQGFTVGLRSDGRVVCAGDIHSDAIQAIGTWRSIARIELKSPFSRYIIGYREDGTIALAYLSDSTVADAPGWKEADFAGWDSISDLIIESCFCVGLRTDGTVLMTANTEKAPDDIAEMIIRAENTVSEWDNIVQIVTLRMDQYNFGSADYDAMPILIVGLKEDGTVVCMDNELLENQNADNDDRGEMRPWPDSREWTHVRELVVRRFGSAFRPLVFGIREDGSVLGMSETIRNVDSVYMDMNECFVLKRDGCIEYIHSLGDNWEQTADWSDIEEIAYGYNGQYINSGRMIARRSDGTVYHFGSPYADEDPFRVLDEWTDVVGVFNSTYNLYGLKSDGTVLTGYRNPWYMMSDEDRLMAEYDEEIEKWQDIVSIVASYGGDPFMGGYEHIVGLKSDGTVVAAGDNTWGQCNLG